MMHSLVVLLLVVVPFLASGYPSGNYVGEVAPGIVLVLRESRSVCLIRGGLIYEDPEASVRFQNLYIVFEDREVPVEAVVLFPRQPDEAQFDGQPAYDVLNRCARVAYDGRWMLSYRSNAVLLDLVVPPGSLPVANNEWGYEAPLAVIMKGGDDASSQVGVTARPDAAAPARSDSAGG